jgi:hypothetical protein
MLRICQVMPVSITCFKKFLHIGSFYSLGEYFDQRSEIWVLINGLYISFYLLYMVTCVVNSVDCMRTTYIQCDRSDINVSDL